MSLRVIIFALSLTQLFALDAQFQGNSLKGSLGDILSFNWDILHPDGEYPS